MVPPKDGFGPMQAIQQPFFKWLKKHVPGFIHSLTTSQLLDKIRSNIESDWKAISLDGKSFDSSQFR